jgi:hypothetical protein
MPYNFKIAMNANISSTVVEEIIRAAVEAQTGKKIATVEIQMDDNKFNGYTVYFDETSAKHVIAGSPDRTFVPATYQ